MSMASGPEHVVKLPPAEGQRWAVGDVHGCARTLRALFRTLSLTPRDQIIFLGDLIDRGPDNRGVLDAVMRWQEEGRQGLGPEVHALQGNHEFMLLDELRRAKWAGDDRYLMAHARRQKCLDLLEGHGRRVTLAAHYYEWLKALPLALTTEGWWLVHGSVNMEANPPLADEEALLWGRLTDEEEASRLGVRIVHGHTPTRLQTIKAQVMRRAHVLPLDAGAVFGVRMGLGHLAALNLDTWQLMITPQTDGAVCTPPPHF